jgi:glycerol uptake facilitator-like aquaporin
MYGVYMQTGGAVNVAVDLGAGWIHGIDGTVHSTNNTLKHTCWRYLVLLLLLRLCSARNNA